jgi:Leucine-rich repeat (LRR) protein
LDFTDEDEILSDGEFNQVLEATQLSSLHTFETQDDSLVEALWKQACNLATLVVTCNLQQEDLALLVTAVREHANPAKRTRLAPLTLSLRLCTCTELELGLRFSELGSVPAIITELSLRDFIGPVFAWAHIVPDLQHLYLIEPREQQTLAFLPCFPHLVTLWLDCFQQHCGDQLANLKHLPHLTELSMSECESLQDSALALLQDVTPALTSLDLSVSRGFSEAMVQYLPRTLTKLDVHSSELRLDCPPLWAMLKNVTSLIIGDCAVNDDALQCLANMTALQHLDLSANYKLTGAGFVWLRHLPLRRLVLYNCRGVTTLEALPCSLTWVDVSATKINENPKSVNALSMLEDLDLSATEVSDEDIRDIDRLPRLRILHIRGCPRLTKACLPLVLEQFPRLEILNSRTFEINNNAILSSLE